MSSSSAAKKTTPGKPGHVQRKPSVTSKSITLSGASAVTIPLALLAAAIIFFFGLGQNTEAYDMRLTTVEETQTELKAQLNAQTANIAQILTGLNEIKALTAAGAKRANDNTHDIDEEIRPRLRVLEQGGVRMEERWRAVADAQVRMNERLADLTSLLKTMHDDR